MGKPIREFESRPLRKQKGNVKALPFFVRLNPVNACVHKDEDGRKSGLAQQGLFVCKDARGCEEISNLALIDARLTVNNEVDLRSKAFFGCKDARCSAEISNLAL